MHLTDRPIGPEGEAVAPDASKGKVNEAQEGASAVLGLEKPNQQGQTGIQVQSQSLPIQNIAAEVGSLTTTTGLKATNAQFPSQAQVQKVQPWTNPANM